MGSRHQFGLPDYLVFLATVVVSVAIGVYYALSGGKRRTTADYLLASRKMSFLPVGISLFVSFESSIMMLGLPAESYMYGVQLFVSFFALALGNVICAYIAVPLLHPLNITSSYEYLELRFKSRAVRVLGSAMGLMYDMCYMGIVLFGPAVALQAVTDFPLWISICGLALSAVVYTTIGGLRAVIWTDVFQTVIMFTGIFAVLIQGTISVGGSREVWRTADQGGRMKFFNFNPDIRERQSFWNLNLALTVHSLTLAFRQSTVQRVCSTTSQKDAKRVMLFVVPCSFLVSTLALYEGVVSYAFYAKKECDPFASGQLADPNQIVPYIVMDIFKAFPGMPGLFVASLFSASLSTLSSSLSSMSALLWTDFFQPVVGDIADWKATLIAKASVVVCGVLACGLAGLISLIGGTLTQIGGVVISAVTGPQTGLFLLAILCPRATAKGVIMGGTVGLAFSCWISAGMSFTPGLKKNPYLPPASTEQCDLGEVAHNETADWLVNGTTSWPEPTNRTTAWLYTDPTSTPTGATKDYTPQGIEQLYTISYTLVGSIGMFTTFILGYLFSIITGPNKPEDVDPRYLLHLSQCPLFCLPGRWTSSATHSENRGKTVPPNAFDAEIELLVTKVSTHEPNLDTQANSGSTHEPSLDTQANSGSTHEPNLDTQANSGSTHSVIPSTATVDDNLTKEESLSKSTL